MDGWMKEMEMKMEERSRECKILGRREIPKEQSRIIARLDWGQSGCRGDMVCLPKRDVNNVFWEVNQSVRQVTTRI